MLSTVSLAVFGIATCQWPRASEPTEWRAYGGDAHNTKYSPVAEIDAENAKDLRVVWRWESPDNEVVRAQSGLHLNLFEVTPVALDGNTQRPPTRLS